ncbi:MAG: DUF4097 domain-containing protein [Thermoanaerobaculales bacterium]|jgi:hypothetical protein|nr:DUF4097 domain-containing protein [Thermoanaerobaculales bacterium]
MAPVQHLRRAVLTAGLAFAAAAAPAAQRDLALTHQFPALPGKTVVVDAADVDVQLRAADLTHIEAEVALHIRGAGAGAAESWIASRTPVFEDSPDTLKVLVSPAKAGFLWFGKLTARARLGLLVPPGVVPDLTTTSGAISVRGDFPDARPLWLRSASGTLSFAGTAASLEVRSTDGDVRVEVIRPLESFTASTSAGDVRLSGGTRRAEVGTASGDIDLEGLSGGLEATTSTGEITISWDRLDADQVVRIRASSGRVRLEVPAGVSPRGRLATTTGSVRSELPGEVEADGSTLQLAGDGPRFDVETASGSIDLEVRGSLD